MSRPGWNESWRGMRSLNRPRRWMTRAEFKAAIKASGAWAGERAFRRLLRTLEPRPIVRHNVARYTPAHLAVMVAAATEVVA